MARERNALKAGSFILTTFALAVIVLIWIRGGGVGPTQTRLIAFKLTDDVGGLRVGDDVRLGGYKVGIVKAINADGLDGPHPRLLVVITLPERFSLHQNTIIGVQTGLTGATNLNIENMGSGAPLPPDTPVPGKPDSKTALLASLGRLAPHLENTITQIDLQTVPKVNAAVETASSTIGQFKELVHENGPDIHGTIKNLNVATATIKDRLPGIADQVQSVIAKVNDSLAKAQVALQDVQATAANAKDITGALRSVIVGNRSKLATIIASIKTTSDNLRLASIEVRRSPWRLLYKPNATEAANLNLYDSAREFAEGAGSLSDAAGALRDALHDPLSDHDQIQKDIEDLDASFAHFHQVESKLWATAK